MASLSEIHLDGIYPDNDQHIISYWTGTGNGLILESWEE